MDIVAKGRRAGRLASRRRDKAKRGAHGDHRFAFVPRTHRKTRAHKRAEADFFRRGTQAERRANAALAEAGESIVREAREIVRELGAVLTTLRLR